MATGEPVPVAAMDAPRLSLDGATAPRVISVSRRTDVPAYHVDWLLARLREGWCEVTHPFTGVRRRVDLRPDAVSALVLWTRDPRPLVPHLEALAEQGYRFTFLVTINDYPRWLEPGAPDLEGVITAMTTLGERWGSDAIVWRYDPVILSDATPAAYHIERVSRLGRSLGGAVGACVTSFVDLYRKTERNLLPALEGAGVRLLEADPARDRVLLTRMRDILSGLGITLVACCEPDLAGVVPGAHCVDRERISRLVGRRVALPSRPTRTGCGCHASVDIGAYDTCPRGCVYCYANRSPAAGRSGASRCRPGNPRLG